MIPVMAIIFGLVLELSPSSRISSPIERTCDRGDGDSLRRPEGKSVLNHRLSAKPEIVK